jgi:predicted Zn-dependent protease
MVNNIRTKQAILIVAILLLVGFLFSKDLKGLVEPVAAAGQNASATPPANAANAPSLTIEEASATAKNMVSESTSKEISALEADYRDANAEEKIELAQKIAQKWDDVEQSIPSAMYTEVAAKAAPSLKSWLLTGDRFLKAFENSRDSLAQPIMLQRANVAFTNAFKIDSTNNDAKTGLGITIVNGMGAPMKGIAMLQEVVLNEPKNLKANMNLGMFAIKSGQFDKAIVRFNNIIANIKATPDAYFYLATAYESLGDNQKAIAAYLDSKKLAANPTLSKFIDNKVAELKKTNVN